MSPTPAVSTIAEVISRLEAIDASLARKDGVAIFDRLYLQVTRAVDAASVVRGHEILPVGGHRNSPWAAANSPHGRPRISPPVLS